MNRDVEGQIRHIYSRIELLEKEINGKIAEVYHVINLGNLSKQNEDLKKENERLMFLLRHRDNE